MTKTILGVLSLLVIMSCSIPVKENTVQPNIMETNKKNLGNLLALYPKPMTVVGAEVEGKVNWLVVGHTGVIGHDRILISMSKSHYTNQGIKDSKRLSVNLVSREILPKADYVGSVSGATVDKSEVFAYHIGENGTPVIDASPLTMECEVVDIYETEGFDNFICAIVNTYAAPEVLDNNGKLDYTKLKPVFLNFRPIPTLPRERFRLFRLRISYTRRDTADKPRFSTTARYRQHSSALWHTYPAAYPDSGICR